MIPTNSTIGARTRVLIRIMYDKAVVLAWNSTVGKVGFGMLCRAKFAEGGHTSPMFDAPAHGAYTE